VRDLLVEELPPIETYDLVVLSVGIHDQVSVHECKTQSVTAIEEQEIYRQILTRLAGFPNVFVRTEPATRKFFRLVFFRAIYNETLSTFPSERTIDHYLLLRSRSSRGQRIKGNSRFHYGPEGRLALVQTFIIFLRNYNKGIDIRSS